MCASRRIANPGRGPEDPGAAPKEAPRYPRARGAVAVIFSCPGGLRQRAGRGPEDPGLAPKEAPRYPRARGAVAPGCQLILSVLSCPSYLVRLIVSVLSSLSSIVRLI